MATPPRTIGQAIADTDLPTAAMFGGLALALIGSLGPWVTAPLGSRSGLDGDGKWTILLALVAGFLLVRRGAPGVGAAVATGVIAVFGIYDLVHIQSVLARFTFRGVQLDHVGWGVYAVIAGAALTLAMMVRLRGSARRRQAL